MPLVIDPSGFELKELRRAASWRGKRVLEIGCGDGRLTLRLATLGPRHIDGMDPDAGRVRAARRNLPPHLKHLIRYKTGSAQHLRRSDGAYDIVVFSWSL